METNGKNKFISYYNKICDGTIQIEEELERYVDILNIFQIYYRNLYNKSTNESLFEGIDYTNLSSTNRSLELLSEFIHDYKTYKELDEKMIMIYNEDENILNYETIYALILDNNIKKLSPSIYSIFLYLASLDWKNINWKIMKVK